MRKLFTLIIICFSGLHGMSQQTDSVTKPKYKIAVFAPLFLDSVFKRGVYQKISNLL